MTSASVIVIGQEILTGKFNDENGPFLLSTLRAAGVDVVRMSVVRDVPAEIEDEVRRGLSVSDWVITTGGVGPTHDDCTLQAVADAVGRPLQLQPELVELLGKFGVEPTPEALRMCEAPEGSELVPAPGGDGLPVVLAGRVWVLPGVPALVKKKAAAIVVRIGTEPYRVVRVFANDREHLVAAQLAEVDAAFPQVDVGSYPRFGAPDHRLIVTLESKDDEALARATEAVSSMLRVVRVEHP